MEPWNQKSQIAQEYGLLPADARQQLTRNQLSSVVREGGRSYCDRTRSKLVGQFPSFVAIFFSLQKYADVLENN